MDIWGVNRAQFDVLHEHAERFVRSNRNIHADIQLKEAAGRILSSIVACESDIKRQEYFWKLYDLFPIFCGRLIEKRKIKTIEDLRGAAFRTGKFRLKLSIDCAKCSLGNLADLTEEFAALRGRVAELRVIGNAPAEFSACVDLMEPRLLYLPNSPGFISNLKCAKQVIVDVYSDTEYALMAAILRNPTIEVRCFI
jgi:hypothetical protein